MEKQATSNHGEGNPEAAERFNDAERNFVDSPRGRQAIKSGAKVAPGEEAELAAAEKLGRSHAKGSDAGATVKK